MESPDSIPTHWTLIHRLRDWDDQESWREFFDTYWRLIYSAALKAGLTETQALEVVQETVITVAKGLKQFESDPARGSFKGWLLHTTRWKIADQFRKRQGAPTARSRSDEVGSDTHERKTSTVDRIPDPNGLVLEAVWDTEWEETLKAAALQRVKAKVDPLEYQIFDLCVLRSNAPKTVAAKLGVKPWKVYFAQRRVGRLLQREVRKLESQQ
jgi:RNA polymerase sigma-70 factor (ECF subfamily)